VSLIFDFVSLISLITSIRYIFGRLDVKPVCKPVNKNRLYRYPSTAYRRFRTIDNTKLIYKFQSAYRLFSALRPGLDIAGQGSSGAGPGRNATGTAVL